MSKLIKKEIYFYATKKAEGENVPLKERGTIRRVTIAGIYMEDGKLYIGKAQCNAKDQFIKAKGRNLAKGRAMSTKPLRIQGVTDERQITTLFHNLAKSSV